MEDIALLTDADEDVEDKDNADKVSLMTVHAAKGLEFPYVYVVGLEENLFPSQMALNSRSDLEEERRLFYVAITRAEKKLTVSYSQSRYKYGNLFQCEPSRFLEEIDEDLLEKPQENKPAKKVNLTEDFPWGGGSSFKKKTSASTSPSKTPTPPAAKVIPANLKKINTNESGITQNVESIGDYVLGCKVEHDKFGTGEITKLEGISPNEKATIVFEEIGEKVLILRFAKLRIVGN
jgi:DNA helicase-2/ATP-dependent DNA helicase PcrA